MHGRRSKRHRNRRVSISPPSDIILDVAQAADPQRLELATARLARIAAGGSADFDLALAASAGAVRHAAPAATPTVPDDHATRTEPRAGSPFQKFEAMVLQSFVESMLPKDTDLFGDAASADAVRSMLADQLATQLSRSGKLGIARAIEAAHGAASADPAAAARMAFTAAAVPMARPRDATTL